MSDRGTTDSGITRRHTLTGVAVVFLAAAFLMAAFSAAFSAAFLAALVVGGGTGAFLGATLRVGCFAARPSRSGARNCPV